MLSRPEQALHVVGRVSWGILVGMWKAKMLRETVRVYPCACVHVCIHVSAGGHRGQRRL